MIIAKTKVHHTCPLRTLTFFSDSFPLAAKGGGMKDGTYLQQEKLKAESHITKYVSADNTLNR